MRSFINVLVSIERLRVHRGEILALAARHGIRNVRVFGSVARYIFGHFTICPTERDRPGYMRDVCVADATNLVRRTS